MGLTLTVEKKCIGRVGQNVVFFDTKTSAAKLSKLIRSLDHIFY